MLLVTAVTSVANNSLQVWTPFGWCPAATSRNEELGLESLLAETKAKRWTLDYSRIITNFFKLKVQNMMSVSICSCLSLLHYSVTPERTVNGSAVWLTFSRIEANVICIFFFYGKFLFTHAGASHCGFCSHKSQPFQIDPIFSKSVCNESLMEEGKETS